MEPDSINELVRRGLITRRPDDNDRRRQLIEITASLRTPTPLWAHLVHDHHRDRRRRLDRA